MKISALVKRSTTSAFLACLIATGLAGCTTTQKSASIAESDAEPVVMFNQDYIASKWLRAGMDMSTVDLASSQSRPTDPSELAIIPEDGPVSFDDPRSVVRLILENAPEKAYVLPTERYFYYQFHLGSRLISGNLRFTEIEDGVLHAGYFDADQNDITNHISLTSDDGVQIEMEDRRVSIEFEGVSASFELVMETRAKPDTLTLLEGEEFITGVLDESGIPLALLWSEEHEAFYFTLNEDYGSPEPLTPFGGGDYLVGRDSRFVYLRDEDAGRLLLTGVRVTNVRSNNYYDGPFDQVPPDLNLRPMLERAYPYVQLRGGIDEHGNFRAMAGSRVAVSPYLHYSTLEEIADWMDAKRDEHGGGQAVYAAITYEPKRDFHKHYTAGMPRTLGDLLAWRTQAKDAMPHMVYMSQGWPANHRFQSSTSWPESHTSSSSSVWPKDHLGDASAMAGDADEQDTSNAVTSR